MPAMHTIGEATESYEAWLGEHTTLVAADLARKHAQMAKDPFAFFRATYYRWAETWPGWCSDLAGAPAVLAVGDLHIENFGTWRDGEGRLAWGINDFDEAYQLPYTNDLTRLATSALLAIRDEHLTLRPNAACTALLHGYRDGLAAGGRPFVLAEQHAWLLRIATKRERNAGAFWKQLSRSGGDADRGGPSEEARAVLRSALPEGTGDCQVQARVAGEGSLGHQRWVAITEWDGGRLAREAKARAPSASEWCAQEGQSAAGDPYADIVNQAVRAPDPALRIDPQWVIRRLAHDCSRVELSSLPGPKLESELLTAMGRETANIHLGSSGAKASLQADLQQRGDKWLQNASRTMLKAVLQDWKAYRRH